VTPAHALHSRVVASGDVNAVPALLAPLATLVEQHGTLYDWAATQPQPRALKGRAPVYVATVPDTTETVVVRHAWHGGFFAPLTTDRFRRPTRAPQEFAHSERLRALGIATTTVLGFARYDAGPGLCRVDVVSRFIPDAFDLGMVAAGLVPELSCAEALPATQALLVQLAQQGVVHPDLNVKNVLLTQSALGPQAMIIDVDVVRWESTADARAVLEANLRRLTRSAKKWRRQFGCALSDDALQQFAQSTIAALDASSPAAPHQ
jgi:Lipopolysaccharide kinase (Kdo/WaaP) family